MSIDGEVPTFPERLTGPCYRAGSVVEGQLIAFVSLSDCQQDEAANFTYKGLDLKTVPKQIFDFS